MLLGLLEVGDRWISDRYNVHTILIICKDKVVQVCTTYLRRPRAPSVSSRYWYIKCMVPTA
jgi:hypothetical protein